jgi:nitrogen fixation protein NifU and related proteins
MFDDLNDLYQQVILDHSKSPRNFRKLDGANRSAKGHNPLCGDQVTIYMRFENDRVEEVSFEGTGCAISKASASLLTDALKGRTTEETRELFQKVRDMVTTGKADGEQLGKLSVFAGVHKFPARVKCAILPWHAALAAVEGKGEPVSTE